MNAVLINGELTDAVSARDRGFQYGDGLFETIAVKHGAPLLLDRHLVRLGTGAERLGFQVSPALLREESERLCRDVELGVLKIIVTRGISARGYRGDPTATPTRVLSLSDWPSYPAAYAEQGVDVRLCRTRLAAQPALAGLKHLNRLEQVLARAEWGDEYAEGLMQDESGNIVEGTMTNVFLVRDETVITPALDRCGIEGVMRSVVLERAAQFGLECRVETVTPKHLEQAQEIFLTSCLIGLWPVRRVEHRNYAVGNVTRKIQQTIRDAYVAA
jgi:4-amino-4-deoxychorismate lyase